MEPQKGPVHYIAPTYDTKERFASYWQQANLIQSMNATDILDIGAGNGFLKDYLQKRRIQLTTIDVDRRLSPNICASVTSLPVRDKSFDLVTCFQVLEHMDFCNFAPALQELRRVSRGRGLISLPDSGLNLRVSMRVDKIINWSILLPFHIVKSTLKSNSEHKWEINRKGYPIGRVTKEIALAGWRIEKHFRLFENPYHRFFTLAE